MICAGGIDPLRLVGDPIDVVTGAVLEDTKDFQVVDVTPIVWRRTYSSALVAIDRGLGVGHGHSFDHRLRVDLDGIRYIDPGGAEIAFPVFSTTASRIASRGHVLTRAGHELTVEMPDRTRVVFVVGAAGAACPVRVVTERGAVHLQHDATGQLVALANDHGASVVLGWTDGHLVTADAQRRAEPRPVRLATYRYAGDRLVEVEDAYHAVVRYAHDASGRIIARADRRGYKFGFTYDTDGRCVHSAAEDGVLEVRLSYFPLEQRTRVVKGDGGVWEYRYDEVGSITSIVDGEGAVRSFVPRATDGLVGTETDGAGNEYVFEYDADGRRIAKRDALGRHVREDTSHRIPATPAQCQLGELGVDPDELPAAIAVAPAVPPVAARTLTFAAAPGAGRLRRVEDIQGLRIREERDGRARRFAYDAGGNLRWEIDLDGARVDYTVESFFQLRAERDANGHTTALGYDLENQLTAVVDPGGARTIYQRDKRSELIAVARAGAWKERYERDGAGRVIARHGPAGLLYTLTRGPQGEVLERKLAAGGFERFAYDARLRVVRAETAAGTSRFAYDRADRRVLDLFEGRGVRHRFEGAHLAETTVLGRYVTRYRVLADGTGRRIRITDPTGRHHELALPGGGVFVRRWGDGRSETTQVHPNGTCLHRVVEGGRAPPWVRSFERSPEGYLLARRDSARGTTRYTHDAAHRVVSEHAPGRAPHALAYDAAGNLVRDGARDATYLPGNLLAASNGRTYAHDAHHAIATETDALRVRRFVRDERGQLVRVETFRRTGATPDAPWQPEPAWSAAYDALNRRVWKTHGGRTTRFVWDTDRLAAEIAPDGRLRVYVYADAFALVPLAFVDYATLEAPPASGEVHIVLADDLGRPERIERPDGAIVWSATFRVYGACEVEVGADFHQPLRWPGHYADTELGLHQNRFRTYSPELGRYLEPDPIGRAGGLENVYAYTQNPLREVDVDGLECPLEAGRRQDEKRKKRASEGAGDEEGISRTEQPAEAGKKLSNGKKMPPGTTKVTYSDGTNEVHCYVDAKGRVIRVEAPLEPPASYKKEGVSHVMPDGFETGRDHRGHLAPERGAPNAELANQPENVIAEHGTKSNLSEKKAWENSVIDHASENPNSEFSTVHEPQYEGDSTRPTSVDHYLVENGKRNPAFDRKIPNPSD